MRTEIDGFIICGATESDAVGISMLYHDVYQGKYPNPLMMDVSQLKAFIAEEKGLWVIMKKGERIIGSTVYQLDRTHRIAKAYGAVIFPGFRGNKLLEKAMSTAENYLVKECRAVDIIYATTRTVTSAPQKVARNLGYKNLGILPNVRKTDKYETHCLTAQFAEGVLENKHQPPYVYPKVKPFYDIVSRECRLPELENAPPELLRSEDKNEAVPVLEVVDAPAFVAHRFAVLKEKEELMTNFFPFYEPNIVIVSPCQKIEIFVHLSTIDRHSIIIGVKLPESLNLTRVLEAVCGLLHQRNARYIEIMARACRLQMIDSIYRSDFVPCAYFPALQLHENQRYDYVVFSKTFEVLNFDGLIFEDSNRDFVVTYYKLWKEKAIQGIF